MSEFLRFGRAFLRHWAGYVTGSVLVAILVIEEHVKRRAVPGWAYLLIGAVAVVASAFQTWRKEWDRAETAMRQLAECRAATDDVVIPDISDLEYWLLAVAQKHKLRREFHNDAGGASSFSIWIGETPIYFHDTRWFYDLVTVAEKKGLIKQEAVPGGNTVYRLPHDSEKILAVSRGRKRPLKSPAQTLHDGRSRAVVEVALPF